VITLKNFRIIALAEATSFLILLVASVLKRTSDFELGVTVMGPLHGFLFLAYIAMAILVRPEQGWDTKTFLLILVGAVVPFGGYVVDRWLTSSSRSTATS
jgi:integral membrane protein